MIQPRLGFSYQLDSRTVLHAGSGIYSGPMLFMNEIGYSSQGFGLNTSPLTSPGTDLPAGLLQNGIPYSPAALTATNFDPGHWPTSVGATNAPPNFTYQNGSKPPRFVQTTIGIEHEFARNLSVTASFIDNRGVWLESDGLRRINQLPISTIAKYGLDVTKPADLALLTGTLASAMANPNYHFTLPYSTFNASGNTLAQSLRPFPQFGNVGDQYERDGNTWYDALQIKVTKRIGHGLSGGLGYSWSKDLGTVSSTGTYTTAIPIQDTTRSPKDQKSLLGIDQPEMLNFYFNYAVPSFSFSQNGWKHALLAGWTLDGIYHYQSGFPIQTPNAASGLLTSATFASGVWSNRVPGQPLFLHNLNSHVGKPGNLQFLNPAAWASPAAGTYATSKPYYGDYRQARQPNEQMGFGKSFDITESLKLSLRADFNNVFNRWVYPSFNNTGNPYASGSGNQLFGVIGNSINNAGGQFAPRQGSIVARIQF